MSHSARNHYSSTWEGNAGRVDVEKRAHETQRLIVVNAHRERADIAERRDGVRAEALA